MRAGPHNDLPVRRSRLPVQSVAVLLRGKAELPAHPTARQVVPPSAQDSTHRQDAWSVWKTPVGRIRTQPQVEDLTHRLLKVECWAELAAHK